MGLFRFAELRDISARAIAAGLAARREALLFAFSPALVGSLSGWHLAPADALRADLNDLNNMTEPVDGDVPMTIWLSNASSMSAAARPDLAKFFDEMALVAAERGAQMSAPAGAPAPPPAVSVTVPEKILFRNALLPDSFMTLAAERARSVARLSIFAYEGGQPRLLPSGNPDGVYGTGWLIGPRHCITNWHVVSARTSGETDPQPEDIARQVETMKVEFDYVREGAQIQPSAVAGLVHSNPTLDYAIIELASAEARRPMPLAMSLPQIDSDHPVAANIIQHPAGEPRRFAIRDNLVAVVQGNELAYFTDTAGGSSGSPVCDDGWRVIALHKASSAHFGSFSFQGKSTAWVNLGTLIGAIRADLQQNKPDLWTAIGAVLA